MQQCDAFPPAHFPVNLKPHYTSKYDVEGTRIAASCLQRALNCSRSLTLALPRALISHQVGEGGGNNVDADNDGGGGGSYDRDAAARHRALRCCNTSRFCNSMVGFL